MRTGFLGQPYADRSPILAAQSAINIFGTLIETKGSEVGGFLGCAGLLSLFQGAGEFRGLWVTAAGTTPGEYILWAVIGASVYRLNRTYNATLIGTLPNYSGPVSMIDNGTQVAIGHQDGWHYATFTGTTLSPVPNSPGGSTLSYLDDYIVYSANEGGQFGITALGDLSSIDALDVATAEGWPDDCVAALADHRELVLFGTETIEIWTDDGAALFPFERVPGGFVEQGLVAKFTPAKLDNSVFWLGRDRNGQGVIYRSNGYIPERISTHAVEYSIRGTIEDAIAFSFQEEGHLFYQITFPTLDLTWAYDVSTKLWHQRAYQDPTTGQLHRHRANCFAHFYDDNLVGDFENGKLYRMSMDLTTDDGSPIYRERSWQLPNGDPETDLEHRRFRVDHLEVTAITGDGDIQTTTSPITMDSSTVTMDTSNITVDESAMSSTTYGAPLIWLQTSRDSGRTWSYRRFRPLGKLGQRKVRARWRRLGSGRDWVFRVATNMSGRVSWGDAYISGARLSR